MKGCSFFPESLLVLFLHAELPWEHARPQLHRWKSLQATCKHTTKKHTKPLGDPFEIKNYTVDTCTYINNIIHVYIIVYIYISCIYIYLYIYIYIYIYIHSIYYTHRAWRQYSIQTKWRGDGGHTSQFEVHLRQWLLHWELGKKYIQKGASWGTIVS